jgi:ribosomal protein S18 acetylase RimI-like enzyme
MSKPNFLTLEALHYGFFMGSFFSSKEQLAGIEYYWSELDDTFWNFARVDAGRITLTAQHFESIARRFKAFRRVPCIYLTPGESLTQQDRQAAAQLALTQAGYKVRYRDLWMLADAQQVIESSASRECQQQIQSACLQDFLQCFLAAYSVAQAGDPYGVLSPAYAGAWGRLYPLKEGQLELLLAYENGQGVGCAAVLHGPSVSGLYGVGVLPAMRRRGIASALTQAAARAALQRGNRLLFLQTEQGSGAHRLYERFGFEELSLAMGWCL